MSCRKNVFSGKQMTTAIAIGTRAMEDLAPLTKSDIYNGVFDIADTATGTASLKFGWPEQTYTNAAIRSTNASLVTGYGDIRAIALAHCCDRANERLTILLGAFIIAVNDQQDRSIEPLTCR